MKNIKRLDLDFFGAKLRPRVVVFENDTPSHVYNTVYDTVHCS